MNYTPAPMVGRIMFFEGWYPLLRILVVGVCVYFFLIVAVRLGGKRTLAQMNMFDFVVNVALGSMFATVILTKDTVLAEGAAAISLLIGLQWLVTYFTAHYPRLRHAVDAEPTLLVCHGRPLRSAMKAQRIGMEDINAAVRGHGATRIEDVDFVILETNGSLNVIGHGSLNGDAMNAVRGAPGVFPSNEY